MRNSRTCDEQDMMNDGKVTRAKACTRAMQRAQCRTGIASKLPTIVKLMSIATNALRTTISHCARETTGLITLVRGPNAGTPRTRSNWFSIVCCETCGLVVWLLYFWFAGAAGVEPTMECRLHSYCARPIKAAGDLSSVCRVSSGGAEGVNAGGGDDGWVKGKSGCFSSWGFKGRATDDCTAGTVAHMHGASSPSRTGSESKSNAPALPSSAALPGRS